MNAATDRRGLWIAVASFVLWGLMPLFWHLLKAVPSLQIVAHRVVWSTLLVAAWLGWTLGRHWLREVLRQPRKAAMLGVSGALIVRTMPTTPVVAVGALTGCPSRFSLTPLMLLVSVNGDVSGRMSVWVVVLRPPESVTVSKIR